jgi:hypothetical protein
MQRATGRQHDSVEAEAARETFTVAALCAADQRPGAAVPCVSAALRDTAVAGDEDQRVTSALT